MKERKKFNMMLSRKDPRPITIEYDDDSGVCGIVSIKYSDGRIINHLSKDEQEEIATAIRKHQKGELV